MAVASAPAPITVRSVPGSGEQVLKLARYQLREYLRSLRFVVLLGIVLAIGLILSVLLGHYRPSGLVTNALAFYASLWGGGVGIVIILAAVIFGGDAIAGEFQNKTGYFLMGLPVRRGTVYLGKFIAAYLASAAMLLVYLLVLLANGAFYFGAGLVPWQLLVSVALAAIYLGAILGTTFFFSSLFKTSAYGFVITAILYLIGFTILQELVFGLTGIEPWFVISYASSTIGNVFAPGVNWGFGPTVTYGPHRVVVGFAPGIGEGIVIMIGYLVGTAAAGLWLFEHEEFT